MTKYDNNIKDIDWQKIAVEYITGNDSVTYLYLANKHNTNHNTVCGRAAREKWMERRLIHRKSIEDNRIKIRSEYQIEDIKELNIEELRIVDEVITNGEQDLTNPKSKVSATELLKALIQKRRIYESIFGDVGEKRQPDTVIDHNVKFSAKDQDKLFATAAKLFIDAGEGESEA